MAAPPDALARATAALHAQWSALRPWLRDLLDDVPDLAARPSALAGWSVADLVAHLGRAMDALAAVTPAPPGTDPLGLRRYVAGYAEGADRITEVTRALAAEIAADPLAHVDRMVATALERLDRFAGADGVVVARRGPITLADMVVSRVLELVVHADDLSRSLPDRPPAPLDPGALGLVSDALAAALREAGGPAAVPVDALGWVRLAAGRAPADVDALARVLAPPPGADLAGAVRLLPLL